MLKINKGVHFSILCIFAVVFVCVYLYYTIADVKKLAIEVKKQNQDIANIVTSITALTKEVQELKKKPAPVCSIPSVVVAPAAPPPKPQEEVILDEVFPEEDESVNTEDVKNIIGDIADDNEVPLDDDIDVILASEKKDYKTLTVDELRNEKYEDIREYCKTNNINAKGAKETLIQRIKDVTST